ncbi:MAG: glycosyltransferase [Clostridia bacterium]
MKILLVMDQFDDENNGTTMSTRRFAETLRAHGNTVKVLGCGKSDENKYGVPERHVPLASYFAHKQGLLFAKAEPEIMRRAIAEADVVHFLMPFDFCKKGVKIAKELGVAYTAAFHVQPENVTYNIGMDNFKPAVNFVYSLFRERFYKQFTHIHCPSVFIANQLKEHNYKAQTHVISNGIGDSFVYTKTDKPQELKDKYVITMVGRLSKEKRQDVLINAVAESKYADKIQLVFAGKGPKADYYKELGNKLPNKPIFGFYKQSELINILGYSDLYVHAADIEIEAIACIEAFATGLVPVIANSPKSATPQFARDERSLFEAGNSKELATKIEYWLDNPEEKEKMEKVYATYAQEYNIHKCVNKIEEMFTQAINENKARLLAEEKVRQEENNEVTSKSE